MSTKYVRDHIRQNAWIRGVISLNKETFEGYGSRAKTSILFLEKKKKPNDETQEPTFLAVASNTGYAPNGAPIPGNVLPDILLDYRAFRKGKPVAQPSTSHGHRNRRSSRCGILHGRWGRRSSRPWHRPEECRCGSKTSAEGIFHFFAG